MSPAYPNSKQIFTAYRTFLSLPYAQQQIIRKTWEQYYNAVKQTPSYGIFQAMREASTEGNMAKVQELAHDAHEMRINGDDQVIALPLGIDPWEYDFGNVMKTYNAINRKIRELISYEETVVEKEEQEVWES